MNTPKFIKLNNRAGDLLAVLLIESIVSVIAHIESGQFQEWIIALTDGRECSFYLGDEPCDLDPKCLEALFDY